MALRKITLEGVAHDLGYLNEYLYAVHMILLHKNNSTNIIAGSYENFK
jgi:hypothetical protein